MKTIARAATGTMVDTRAETEEDCPRAPPEPAVEDCEFHRQQRLLHKQCSRIHNKKRADSLSTHHLENENAILTRSILNVREKLPFANKFAFKAEK